MSIIFALLYKLQSYVLNLPTVVKYNKYDILVLVLIFLIKYEMFLSQFSFSKKNSLLNKNLKYTSW